MTPLRRFGAGLLTVALPTAACTGGHAGGGAAARTATTAPPTAAAPTTSAPPPTTTTTAAPAVGPDGRPLPRPCPPVPPRAQPRPDRTRYRLSVDVRPAQGTASGSMTAVFTPDLPTDRLVLRLWPNGPVLAAAGARLDPGAVTVDGRPQPASRPDPTTLVVPVHVDAGRSVTVTVPWQLAVAGPVPDRVSRVGDAVRLGSFFPVLAWEPGVGWATDPPTRVHGEASTAAAADFDLTVSVPPGYDVLATGVPDGAGHWTANAVPDVGLSVGHFTFARGTAPGPRPVPVTVGVQAGVAESPQLYLGRALQAIDQYQRRFGAYPWPVYTLAITPGLVGGIEYPMHVMQGPASNGRSTSHEIAHQWFYALVENDQARDPWLDEGLATWAETGVEGTLGALRARAVPADGRGQLGRPTSYWDSRSSVYFASVYVQAVQALAALGPPPLVDCALALYVALHAYRIARPADLVGALQTVFADAPAVLARYGVQV